MGNRVEVNLTSLISEEMLRRSKQLLRAGDSPDVLQVAGDVICFGLARILTNYAQKTFLDSTIL